MTDAELIGIARAARENAYAPYSDFSVGVALLATDGRVFTGVNVENASIGLSVCAERNAISKAVSEGARSFMKLAVATGSPEPTMPCGVCRQVIWEFGHDVEILVVGSGDEVVKTTIADLFPQPFTTFE